MSDPTRKLCDAFAEIKASSTLGTPHCVEKESIADVLQRVHGLSIAYEVLDAGGLNKQSVFLVLVKKGDRAFNINYHKGAAHRKWKRNYLVGLDCPGGGAYWAKYIKPKKRVELPLVQLLDPEKCKPESRQRQQDVFNSFAHLTEPEPPTIDEVMYSLVMDSSGVRHGQPFEDWCGDFGFDGDSRKAEQCFDACIAQWRQLIWLGVDLDALETLFQDY